MTRKLLQGIVSDRGHHVIHIVRVLDDILDLPEIDEIAGFLLRNRSDNAALVCLAATRPPYPRHPSMSLLKAPV